MIKHRPLFVASPATASLAAGLESSARKRGHSAITVVDVRHAPSIARAFRPGFIVALPPPGDEDSMVAACKRESALRGLPVLLLASGVSPTSTVAAFAAGASAVEAAGGGVPAVERARAWAEAHAEFGPAARALAALQGSAVTGALRVAAPHNLLVRLRDGAVVSAHAGPLEGEAALERVRAVGIGCALAFEGDEDIDEVTDADISPIEDAPLAEEAVRAQLGPACVLVVEDNAELLRMYTLMLEHEGFVVAAARDGVEGFERAVAELPDLIVTDIQMPRSDGWELLGRVRDDARVREIPIVVVSAFTDMLGQLRGMRVGADAYVEKAGPKAELVGVVRALIERRRQARVIAASHPAPCGGRLEHIGAAGLLRTLEEAGRTGSLIVDAGWGEIIVRVVDGVIESARALVDDVALDGSQALLLLLELGETRWRFTDDVGGAVAPVARVNARFSTLQADLARELNARRLMQTVAGLTRRGLTIVEERARVYVGTAEEARALVERMQSGETIDARTRAAFVDLVRRGVARV